MKKLILFCFVLLAAGNSLQAQSFRRSLLKIRLADRSPFSVEVDGRRYNKTGTSLTIGDLPAGRHSLRIYRVEEEDGYDHSYAQLVYKGRLQTTPGTTTFCVVDVARGDMRVRVEYNDRPAGPPPQGAENAYGDDRADNYNREDDRPREPYTDNRGPGYNQNTLSQRDIDDLRARVEKRITDTDKEGLMKTALDTRTCTTAQVVQLLHLLSFESTRLDFAKWAYTRVTDRRDYWKIEDEFTFSSSKEELQQFIQSQR